MGWRICDGPFPLCANRQTSVRQTSVEKNRRNGDSCKKNSPRSSFFVAGFKRKTAAGELRVTSGRNTDPYRPAAHQNFFLSVCQ